MIRRFLAFVIDWNITLGVAMALMFFGPGSNPEYFYYPSIRMLGSLGFLLGLIWLFIYGLAKDCFFGRRSLGKALFGLVILNAKTGERASFGQLILRNITAPIVQIEGLIVLLNHGARLGDVLANTKVVKAPAKK